MCAYIFRKFEIGGRRGVRAIAVWRERLLAASSAADFEFSKNERTGTPSPRPPLQFRVLHIFDRTTHGPGRWDRARDLPPAMTHT